MDITTFLAQLWGPTILAISLGVFVNRSYYIKIYRDLERSPLTVLVFGMIALTAGIAHIHFHNVWDTLPHIIVSLLGWSLLIKGALFLLAPNLVNRMGDNWANLRLVPFAGGLMLLVGGYLTWFAYLG